MDGDLIRYECDKCGTPLGANDSERFIVRIEAYAADSPIEFSKEELAKSRPDELRRLIEQLKNANPDEMEDQTYRSRRFDLCAGCHREFLKHPLGR